MSNCSSFEFGYDSTFELYCESSYFLCNSTGNNTSYISPPLSSDRPNTASTNILFFFEVVSQGIVAFLVNDFNILNRNGKTIPLQRRPFSCNQ